MTVLAINWGNAWMQVFYLILSLSILVVLHEFGHYITAKWFGCRVEKFYLFFNPWFSLVKKKVGETEYGIGWLPLGGYVKIAGMIDESMDKEALKEPPKAYEFRSKPAWQRLIIMLGGIIVNVLLAFIIYAMVLFVWGEKKVPVSSLQYGVWVQDSVLYELNLRNGDNIVAVDNKPVEYFEDVPAKILLGKSITISRNGQQRTIEMPENFLERLIESKKKNGMLLMQRLPALVGEYDKNDSSNGKKAGLQFMDKITAIDSIPVQYYDDMTAILANKKNTNVSLTIERRGDTVTQAAAVNADGKIGIPLLSMNQYDSLGVFKQEVKKYGFFEAIPAGIGMALDKLKFYIDQFRLILNPKTGAYKGLGGFKAIGSIFPTQWGEWESFWRLTGFLSIILAFMNLLPIPALDGGHVVFTLVEMVTGRKPSDKFLEYAQIVGMVLLLGLMLFANFNDWFGYGRGR
ncbi:MAG TPA: RIP metalloprotease RseP [Ferruginibacter sp.]|nr:RIP metalloprotease RseP [Ferruginibacter sp.]HMP20370.1 RIP metalloprotease RseP [Ferruginibacter sp.]